MIDIVEGLRNWAVLDPTIAAFTEAADEIDQLREVISRIRIAAEFHGQEGVADHVMRYAHESTKRLCDEALKGNAA